MTGTTAYALNQAKITTVATGVNDVYFDNTGDMVVELRDGTTVSRPLKDIKSADLDDNDHLIITYSDNTTHDAGLVNATITIDDLIYQGPTAPSPVGNYIFWVDTSNSEIAVLKYYNTQYNEWRIISVVQRGDAVDLKVVNGEKINLVNVANEIIGNGIRIAELGIEEFKTEIVTELPTENISSTTVYLLNSKDGKTGDSHQEWVYTSGGWERLGTYDETDEVIDKSLTTDQEIKDLFK